MRTQRFDDVMHAPNRLQICAYRDSIAEIEFQALRNSFDVSDAVL